MVIDPKAFLEELAYLQEHNISDENLYVSNRAHVILPYHIKLDMLQEEKGNNKIGTTKKGIGPAYTDKIARIGIRMADLLDEKIFREKLKKNVKEKNRLFTKLYDAEPVSVDDIFEEYYTYGQKK